MARRSGTRRAHDWQHRLAGNCVVSRLFSQGRLAIGCREFSSCRSSSTPANACIAEKTRLEITRMHHRFSAKLDRDFRPLHLARTARPGSDCLCRIRSGRAPADGGPAYDSYAGLDVKDKIVLVLRYVPESVDRAPGSQPLCRPSLQGDAGARARREGCLIATGPNSPHAGELVPLTNDFTNSASGIIAASINGQTVDALLVPSGKTLKELQSALDIENPHAESGSVLPKVKVALSCGVEHLKKHDADVVAYLPPSNSDEYVAVGAHYDHLGHGGSSSLIGPVKKTRSIRAPMTMHPASPG